jgi:lantibiotic biosynthesis protein
MKSWRPLLTGALAERARQAVDEIAAALAPAPAPAPTGGNRWRPDGPEDPERAEAPGGDPLAAPEALAAPAALAAAGDSPSNPSLAGGTAGVALFFAYRAGRGDAPGAAGDSDAAGVLLERTIEALATTPLAPDLFGGFAGVAWTAEHLYGPRFTPAIAAAAAATEEAAEAGEEKARARAAAAPEAAAGTQPPAAPAGEAAGEDAEDPLAEIDAALLRYLDHSPWTADFDLIRGLAGFGVYALERLPRPSAVACLTKIVDRLAETAEHGPQGTTWHTAPELLPDWQRKIFPGGYYNLGVAHGVPAVVAMLGATAAAAGRVGAAGDPAAAALAGRARSLAEGALRWLLAQQLPPGEASRFGATFSPEAPPQRSRLAWCYGDPGIAAALLVTARASGDAALERLAIELALEAAGRPMERSGVRDAGLCHGSAGLAHLFNRMYQETGEPRLADVSRRWFEQALDFRQPGLGLAGYRAFQVEDDGVTERWRADPGLLEGVAGIGLALLGGLGDFEPAWDRILMLSAAGMEPAPS